MSDYSAMPDEQLVRLVCSRDRELYRYLVDRYQAKLVRYATYLLADSRQAADVVQDTFIKAYVNLRSFNPARKFSSWIYRIAHNEAMNMLKKHRREVPLDPALNLPADSDPQREYAQKETAALVRACLSRIPLSYSEPLSLFYLEDKSYTEISDILRLPAGTVGTRISRGKMMLHRLCPESK